MSDGLSSRSVEDGELKGGAGVGDAEGLVRKKARVRNDRFCFILFGEDKSEVGGRRTWYFGRVELAG